MGYLHLYLAFVIAVGHLLSWQQVYIPGLSAHLFRTNGFQGISYLHVLFMMTGFKLAASHYPTRPLAAYYLHRLAPTYRLYFIVLITTVAVFFATNSWFYGWNRPDPAGRAVWVAGNLAGVDIRAFRVKRNLPTFLLVVPAWTITPLVAFVALAPFMLWRTRAFAACLLVFTATAAYCYRHNLIRNLVWTEMIYFFIGAALAKAPRNRWLERRAAIFILPVFFAAIMLFRPAMVFWGPWVTSAVFHVLAVLSICCLDSVVQRTPTERFCSGVASHFYLCLFPVAYALGGLSLKTEIMPVAMIGSALAISAVFHLITQKKSVPRLPEAA